MQISINRRMISVFIFILLEGLITLGWFNRSTILPYFSLGLILLVSSLWIIKNRRNLQDQVGIGPFLILLSFYTLYRFISIGFAPLPLHGLEVAAPDLFLLLIFNGLLITFPRYWKQEQLATSIFVMASIFTLVNFLFLGIRFVQIENTPGIPLLSTFLAYRLPGGLLGHPNFEAAFINLVIPFALVCWYQSNNRRNRAMWSIIMLILLVIEYFCSSRGAWLSLLISGSMTISLLWLSRFEKIGIGIKALRKFITPARVCTALLLLAVAAVGFNRLLSFEVEQRAHAPISTARTKIWNIGLDVVRESPWLGSGPGSFHYLSAWFSNIPPGFFLSHAHNVWIQITAESGIPGLLLALAIAVFILLSIVRGWNTREYDQRLAIVPIAGAITGLFFHNLVDFTFDVPLVSFLFICFLVILDRNVTVGRRLQIQVSIFGILLLAGSIFYLVLAGWNYRGSELMQEGVAAAKSGSWTQAATFLCEAGEKAPGYTFYGFQCGLALATLAEHEGNSDFLNAAMEHYRQSLENDPYWPVHWANLAALEFSMGEEERAIDNLSNASQQATRNVILLINLGWMHEQSGKPQLAVETYEKALVLDPWLIRSSFMKKSGIRRALFDPSDGSELVYLAASQALSGWISLDREEYGQAQMLFTQNLQADPLDALSHAGMALTLLTGPLVDFE